MSLALLKPDHLGDLVLSSAAIHAICAGRSDVTLFVASKNLAVARWLFPDVELRAIDLPHLSKSGDAGVVPDLSDFDTVVALRNDGVINRQWAQLRTRHFIQPADTLVEHQSLIDYTVACRLVGPYDIDRAFFGERIERVIAKAGRPPKRIGLSIGSGFHANAWPMERWVDTARRLLDIVDEIQIVAGPAEIAKAAFISSRLESSAVSVLIGNNDIGSFIAAVDELDLVVATDGGTAHLCSLVAPVVSVFGPSPFRRYAPFGRLNRLLTREMPCSPCCQYTRELVNGCLTTECVIGIAPDHVLDALGVRVDPMSRPRSLEIDGKVRLHLGVSHAARADKLARWHRDMSDDQSTAA